MTSYAVHSVSQALTRTHRTRSPQSNDLIASTTLGRAASFSSGDTASSRSRKVMSAGIVGPLASIFSLEPGTERHERRGRSRERDDIPPDAKGAPQTPAKGPPHSPIRMTDDRHGRRARGESTDFRICACDAQIGGRARESREMRPRCSPILAWLPRHTTPLHVREAMTTTDIVLEIRRACRQTGVTTAERLDLTDRQRQAAVNKGLLTRWPRGVLLDPAYPDSPRKALAAATSVGRPYAAAWGRSCMAMWRVLEEHPSMPEVVVPEQRYARIPG